MIFIDETGIWLRNENIQPYLENFRLTTVVGSGSYRLEADLLARSVESYTDLDNLDISCHAVLHGKVDLYIRLPTGDWCSLMSECTAMSVDWSSMHTVRVLDSHQNPINTLQNPMCRIRISASCDRRMGPTPPPMPTGWTSTPRTPANPECTIQTVKEPELFLSGNSIWNGNVDIAFADEDNLFEF